MACLPNAPDIEARPQLQISKTVLDQIRQSIGRLPPESGGLLGGARETGVVTHFHFDDCAKCTGVTYTPDFESLNRLLSEHWNPKGIRLLGFVHSHPPWIRRPSTGDLAYAERLLKANQELDRLLLPIAISDGRDAEKTFELLAFSAVREQGQVRLEALDLVQVETPVQPSPVESPLERSSQIQKKYWIGAVAAVTTVTLISLVIRRKQLAKGRGMKSAFDPGKTFARVRQAYDLQRLAASRVIVVGVGGGTSCVENLARAGVGEFILIDRDIISETNLATQQSYRKDIGRPKVQCVAERIRDINPHARVVCKTKMLDEIDDGDFEHFFSKPLGKRPPAVSLLCGFTDCFFAQARVNRLALHFGVPSLCAQVYRQGRGAEVTFMHPLTTPACHRCALSSRYTAYLEEDFKNDVTSEGSPIFATSRLNALKGFIAMALLHQGTEHWRWATLLERIGDRSLVQIRMDPDLNLPVFEKVFGGDEHHRILFDEAVWLPQKPNCPENGYPACPDCGGSGDLRTAIGTFQDTRLMRK